MKVYWKKVISVAAAVALLSTALSGCGDSEELKDASGRDKLTYWCSFYPHYAKVGTSMADSVFYQELMKRTNTDIEFIHPPTGEEASNFSLMTASGDLPDIIEYSFISYKGGPERAISDNIIQDITDKLEEKAPNLYAQLKANPDWDKQVKTDSGKYYCFPAIRGAESLLYWNGPQIRQDYLEQVNMEVPETISEWDAMLRAFKEQLGLETPLTLKSLTPIGNAFVGAFGVTTDFFLDDGKVTYGPLTDGFAQYLELMAGWVADGLLDPDFATHDSKTYDAQISSGKAGAYVGSVGGDMGKYITATQQQNPQAKLVAAKYPVLEKGQEPTIGFKDFAYIPGQSASITTACKNEDAAFRLLDYAYDGDTKEGYMLFNFGIEGVSYNMIDGYPTYTDEIIHPTEEGTTVMHAMTQYCRAAVMGPMIQDERYFEQYMVNPEQKETAQVWQLAGDASWRMPNVTYTVEESNQITSKLNEIAAYVGENSAKFILGTRPLSELEDFRNTIRSMGIDEVLEVQQAAVDRYNAR